MGGFASELAGGDFASGALGASMVYLYNDLANYLLHKRIEKLWDLNGDGKISLNEAERWYHTGHGKTIYVDASKLTVLHLENRDIVLGSDYFVHGQVSLDKDNHILGSWYDFDIKHNGGFLTDIRNAVTVLGWIHAGNAGLKYHTDFYNKPNIIDLTSKKAKNK
jgi:hypothetical protein